MNKDAWFEKVAYKPHAEQRAMHDSNARNKLVVTPRRWGKTTMLTKEAEALLMTPNTYGWVVAETQDMVMAIMEEILRETNVLMQRGRDHHETFHKNRMILEYPWGARVEGKMARRPESMEGYNDVDWVVWDNCAMCDEGIWIHIQSALKKQGTVEIRRQWYVRILQKLRIMKPKFREIEPGRVVMATTPLGRNWVYHLWCSKRFDPDWRFIQGKITVNPSIPDGWPERMRAEMGEQMFKQEILGMFPEG